MNEKLDNFLNHFSRREKDNVVELCKRISQYNATVNILMARKAACFLDCLRSLDVFNPIGYVTSERILDMNTEWLTKDSKVCIVDDTIISGTTIYRTIKKLHDLGITDIKIFTLSVNEKWFDDSVINNTEFPLSLPYITQSDGECVKQCKDIVSALSLFPRPYDVDFPYSLNHRIKSNKGQNILQNPYWEIHDVSSPLQQDGNIKSFTLLPTNSMNAIVCEMFDGFPWINHFKIRLYCTLAQNGKSIRAIRIVPIAILHNLSSKECNRIFEQTINNFQCSIEDKDILTSQFCTPTSRYRFLQFIIASHIGTLWANQVSISLGYRIEFSPNQQSLELIFSPPVCPLMKTLNLKQTRLVGMSSDKQDVSIVPLDYKSIPIKTYESSAILHHLLRPFIWLYHEKEIPMRRYVKEHGIASINDSPNTLKDRLLMGFTFSDIVDHLGLMTNDEICDKNIVSLFLDSAIDEGIVVPICGETKDDLLFRGFRHGEDVVFAEEEFKMLYQLYSSFLNEVKKEDLSHFLVEKLAVVFLQTGAIFSKPSLLHTLRTPRQWTNAKRQNPNLCVARVKTYLQGPIVIIERKVPNRDFDKCYLSTDSHSSWLNRELTKSSIGILKKQNKAKGYLLATEPDIPLPKSKEGYAKSLGSLLGHLAVKKADDAKPILNINKDLIILTTGLDIRCALSALVADAAIVSELWNKDIKRLLDRIGNSEHEEISQDDIKIFRKSKSWMAVNAGREKFHIVLSKQAQTLIERIRANLNPRDLALWDSYWRIDEIVTPVNCGEAYWQVYEEVGFWMLSMKGYISTVFLCCELCRTFPSKQLIDVYIKEIGDCENTLKTFRKPHGKAHDILTRAKHIGNNHNNVVDARELLNSTIKLFPYMHKWIYPRIEHADYLVQDFGKEPEPPVQYTYALFISIIPENEFVDSETGKLGIEKLLSQYILDSKTPYHLKLLPDRLVPKPFDLAVISTGNRENTLMSEIIKKVCKRHKSPYKVKFMMLSQLPKMERILSRADDTDNYWMDTFVENLDCCIKQTNYPLSEYSIIFCYPNTNGYRSEFAKLSLISNDFELGISSEHIISESYTHKYFIEKVIYKNQNKGDTIMIDKSTNIGDVTATNSNVAISSDNATQNVAINTHLEDALNKLGDFVASHESIGKQECLSIQKDIEHLRNELSQPKPNKKQVDSILSRWGSIASITSFVTNIATLLPPLF